MGNLTRLTEEKQVEGASKVLDTRVDKEVLDQLKAQVRQKVEAELDEMMTMALGGAQDLTHAKLYTLEKRVRDAALRLGGAVLEWAVAKGSGAGYEGAQRCCEHCKKRARFHSYRTKTLRGLVMEWELRRAYYYCDSCKSGAFPLEERLGLHGMVSPAMEEALVRVHAEVPFERASVLFERLSGVRYNGRDAREVTEAWGMRLEKEAQAEQKAIWKQTRRKNPIENPSIPERLYISPDGTTVPTEDGWKEAKVATIFSAKKPLKKGEDPERERTRYVAGMENSQTFGQRLYIEALKQNLEQAEEVIVVADGGAWIWHEADLWLRKNRVEIIDFYHASEKIWEVARQTFGEGQTQTQQWAERWVGVLYRKNAEAVIPAIQRLPGKGAVKETIRQTVGYFTTHRHRMQYGRLRRNGYFIGSGVTESTCKHLVGSRLKQAGMCWNTKNANAMLQLRAAILNDRWDYRWN